MCKCLKISRSTYYFIRHSPASQVQKEFRLERTILNIFQQSRSSYGTRRIRQDMKKQEITVSRRKIAVIMNNLGLISKYTKAHYRVHKSSCNEDLIANTLNRSFNKQEPLTAVVSDLTYIRVGAKWNYICILLDLYNRKIIGFSVGERKDAALVSRAFASVPCDLSQIKLFHTDRGREFKNEQIEALLHTFGIERSLSMKGCPYDNAVAEATFKTIKTEFVYGETFRSLDQLRVLFADYVHWYNNFRLHSSLDYVSPNSFQLC